jgi:Na+/H+ antiporter NhaD/arsenite permease-like protein
MTQAQFLLPQGRQYAQAGRVAQGGRNIEQSAHVLFLISPTDEMIACQAFVVKALAALALPSGGDPFSRPATALGCSGRRGISPPLMDSTVIIVFAFVYLGMILGGLPGWALDRTGVALLGAILLLVSERVGPQAAWNAIDVPTMALLFGLMVVSAQFRLSGLYGAVTRRLAAAELAPPWLLLVLILVSALLSALLANDIVCLAMAPLLVEGCLRRGLKPAPFLLGLACASNIGSAATLIGNPQNMLIGQKLQLSFSGYLWDGLVPAALGCLVTWAILGRQVGGDWYEPRRRIRVQSRTLDRWQTGKGMVVLTALVLAFLFSPWPREVLALAAAGGLLLSRRMHSHVMLGQVDWQLLVLFAGLFVVNHAVAETGLLTHALHGLRNAGIPLSEPAWLFGATVVLSNVVSNVPAVMLLLPAAVHPQAGAILALASTLAGNLFIVGSIANIIVVEQAARLGVRITWRQHARVGVPVTVATLLVAAGWLYLRALA